MRVSKRLHDNSTVQFYSPRALHCNDSGRLPWKEIFCLSGNCDVHFDCDSQMAELSYTGIYWKNLSHSPINWDGTETAAAHAPQNTAFLSSLKNISDVVLLACIILLIILTLHAVANNMTLTNYDKFINHPKETCKMTLVQIQK